MNREKYESLKVVDLKALCKARGVKDAYKLKKDELVNLMLELDKRDEALKANAETKEKKPAKSKAESEENLSSENDSESGESPEESKEEKPKRKYTKNAKTAKGKPAKRGRVSKKAAEELARKEAEFAASMSDNEVPEESTEEETETIENSDGIIDENTQIDTEEAIESQEGEESAEEKDEEAKPERVLPPEEELEDRSGILEVLDDGYGFLRSENYLPGSQDVYVSPAQIHKFGLRTGDLVVGSVAKHNNSDKYSALLLLKTINGDLPEKVQRRPKFEKLTPIFPNSRIRLERPGCSVAMRIVDFISPIGKGQRGMIVSQPKAGKTTLLKQIAASVKISYPEMHLIILLIDERPEEVTDMKEAIEGDNAEVVYSTFDELPEHHKRVSEMVIERAKRLVEQGKDVMILLDSITRLSRAYNLTVPPSGRTLSGGLDPAALHMPKRFFGAARNMREGGSLTILATALVETGSKMDDVVFEEFKGTGNMELVLDRKLSEKRVFPAIDLARSSTRREDLLLSPEEAAASTLVRRALVGLKKDEAGETILHLFTHTKDNKDFVSMVNSKRFL